MSVRHAGCPLQQKSDPTSLILLPSSLFRNSPYLVLTTAMPHSQGSHHLQCPLQMIQSAVACLIFWSDKKDTCHTTVHMYTSACIRLKTLTQLNSNFLPESPHPCIQSAHKGQKQTDQTKQNVLSPYLKLASHKTETFLLWHFAFNVFCLTFLLAVDFIYNCLWLNVNATIDLLWISPLHQTTSIL